MISVIIVNFNGRDYLELCLSSLALQTFRDYEVIVIDNASSDGSVEYLKAHFPDVILVRATENLGFAGGVNAGIRVASGEYIMTLNNDTRIDPDCLFHLMEVMEPDDSVGMTAGKMLFFDRRINSTGICISRSGAAWDRGMYEEDMGQYDRIEEVFGPCAGAALYRRQMLEEVGLFDEDFFLYMEDVDLAFRARLLGWKCVYTPYAHVYHIHGGTAGVGSDLAVYYGNRNVLWYVLKDFPVRILITSLPWIIGRNLAVIPYYMMKGRGWAILKAKIGALRGAPAMLRRRKMVRQTVPDGEVMRFILTWSSVGRYRDVAGTV
ncbi:glycosyltransferase family 2 protein [Methanocalculus sp.]|uniref:glycosyltransferase family 2 protein n=1 Tax=Methanocalculus sp. TaxID=2004547 RepID=UPI00271CD10A|nr:glycosyltransferase family 2 protein [Methanocalculus sp.]MDO8842202.1 glycosyltransferase family 2 protein [Methanocalculus sp.]